ncbi:terpenoid synthase [Schizopora paradoxa]|uniref:(2E,6E)-farnesyl diphosphate synthase n=1 Tax=Schizopora paradoxa TaxID=27342 RepID=A0A0H2S7F5_9AGAM|nr:terpenoid synthase [Schizopora paradoxa]
MQRWGVRAVRAVSACSEPATFKSTINRRVARHGLRHHGTRTATARVPTTEPGLPPGSPSKSASTTTSHGQRSTPVKKDVDPYALVSSDLEHVRTNLIKLLGSANPTLTSVASYYFKHPSKQLRPLLVLLFAQATNGLGGRWEEKCAESIGERADLDWPLSRPDILTDWNPNMPEHTSSFESAFELVPPTLNNPPHIPAYAPPTPRTSSSSILPTQVRLAQIVEMIHVASLLHDDVIDESSLRRCAPSAPAAFGSKISILAGDFMLGRASAALSRLGDAEVVELMSCVVANLVEGEVMQMRQIIPAELGLSSDGEHKLRGTESIIQTAGSSRVSQEVWNVYLKKTFLKTASLMAKSVRASVVLGGAREGEVWKEVAYAYGRNLGIAFQLVDDILDYEAGEGTLGKPGGADLHLGLATGPALFAWEEHPSMGPLIERKFERSGDVELARDLVRRSSGVERTRDLARAHADKAREVLQLLPVSDARRALEVVCERMMKRTR